jgi:hypothetical protein
MRILGIAVDKPEVSPGDTVSISVVASWPDQPSSESLTHAIVVCPDPGVSRGENPSCEGVPGSAVALTPTTVSWSNTSNTDLFSGIATITIPTTYLANSTDVEKAAGRPYLIEYVLNSSSGKKESGIRRIRVTDSLYRPTKTSNPALNGILVDGIGLATYPTQDASLSLNIPESAVAISDDLVTTWFVTDGSLPNARTEGRNSVKWTPTARDSSSRRAAVVSVSRSSEGGLTVQIVNDL